MHIVVGAMALRWKRKKGMHRNGHKNTFSLGAICRIIGNKAAVFLAKTGIFEKRIHWFCSTIPLISFNDSIEIVLRFH
jgi:hypothetical protein